MLHPKVSIQWEEHLAIVLGFRNIHLHNQTDDKVLTFIGDASSDINGGIHHLYMYCDVLEHVAVGDSNAQLLGIVKTAGRYGEVVHKAFKPLRYLPVRKKYFDTVEIDI